MKKNLKRTISMFLMAIIACNFLTGCSKSEEGTDITTITWYIPCTKDTDHDIVMEEVNKKLEEKYSMRLELYPIPAAEYSSKMQVLNATQDTYDLMWIGSVNSLVNNAKSGALTDITELLPKYAPKLYESISKDAWDAARVDKKIYAAPNWQIMARSDCLVIPKKYLEETGYSMDELNTMKDLDKYMEKLHPIFPDANRLFETRFQHRYYGFVELLDETCPGMIRQSDRNSGQTPVVVNQYASKEFFDHVSQRYEWNKKGLIADTYSPDSGDALKLGRQPFVFETTYKPGIEAEQLSNKGIEVECKQFSDAIMTPNAVLSTATAVSATSPNPEKAVEFLEIVNNDPEIYNMIVWGIEGTHYDKIGENIIKPKNLSLYGYYAWAIGSQANCYLLDGQQADLWEKTAEFNDSAIVSPVMGLVFNTEDIVTEITDCGTVISERVPMLLSGLVEPESGIADLLSTLQKAGSDKIINELQRQIDDWYKNK